MYCPRCGTGNVGIARFCRGCGCRREEILLSAASEESPCERLEQRLEESRTGYTARSFRRVEPLVPGASLHMSWKLVRQGYLSALRDVLYGYLLPTRVRELRLLLRLIKSPMEWRQERRRRRLLRLDQKVSAVLLKSFTHRLLFPTADEAAPTFCPALV